MVFYVAYSAMLINEYNQDIVYPADLSRGAQITLPASLLSQVQPIGEEYYMCAHPLVGTSS